MKIMSISQKRSILETMQKHAFPRPQFQKLLTLFLFLPPIPKILSFGSEWVETTFSHLLSLYVFNRSSGDNLLKYQ